MKLIRFPIVTLCALAAFGAVTQDAFSIETYRFRDTNSGDVELHGVATAVTMATVSGDITVEQASGGFDLSTTSGSVSVRSGGKGEMRVETVSGSVTLAIDPVGIGNVILESPSGEMDIDAPVHLRKHSRDRLTGRMGEGTSTLRVHTSSGNILVSEL